MNVERGTSTHGRYCAAKPTRMNARVRLIFSAASPRDFCAAILTRCAALWPIMKISAAKPVHHTAGLPMQEIEEIQPSGMNSVPE